jgi:[acyl-carrier-protein] S-malonyltransferase
MNNFDACDKAFLFPGQSAQTVEMLDEYKTSKYFNICLELITNLLGENPEKYLNKDGYIHKNEVASLLTVLCSVCALNSLKNDDKPYMTAGYSVGQYTAMHASGMLNLEHLFELVYKRAILMNACAKKLKSVMLAVIGLTNDQVNSVCKSINHSNGEIYISNYNCLGQVTLASSYESSEIALIKFNELSARKVMLLTSEGGWHSPFMKEAEKSFLIELSNKNYFEKTFNNVICNRHGDFLQTSDRNSLNQCLSEHISHPVLWEQGIKTLISKEVSEFVEIGYGNTLTKFGFFIDRKKTHIHYKQLT